MNREQKAAAIAEIADSIKAADAVFAVDFRGISVPQAADLRTRLRDADASFRVVKNTLTERAADQAGVESLKTLLQGPTALTFVRGDAATAAKALRGFNRETQLLAFKGGVLAGEALDAQQVMAIAQLPTRDVLYGQLVGVVAAPVTGLARGLNALLSGVAIALGQIREKAEAGEITLGTGAGAAPSAPAAETPAEPGTDDDQDAEAPEPPAAPEDPAEGPDDTSSAPAAAADQDAEAPEPPAAPEDPAEGADDETAEPAGGDDQDAEAPEPPAAPEDPAEGAPDAGIPTDDQA